MRLIAPESHPSNIAVFEAVNMTDAVMQASDAFSRHGIQGAMWFRPAIPIDWAEESKLGQAFKAATGAGSLGSYTVSVLAEAGEDNTRIRFLSKKAKSLPIQLIEQTRRDNLEALIRLFGNINLAIRHECKGSVAKHYDGFENSRRESLANRLFAGEPIRILCTREGPGTLVYDPADDTELPWQAGIGSYLFLTAHKGIPDKALLHSPPEFNFPLESGRLRVVDVYSCRHG